MPTNQGWGVGSVRTVFISDVHLGHQHSQGRALIHFLEDLRPKSLYLVGDIIDGWALGHRSRWSPACTDVLRRLSDLADQGTRLYYTPGNHDAFLRDTNGLRFVTERFDFVRIADEFVFDGADGRRFLVTHGDLFDVFERSAQWISVWLGRFYNACLSANRMLSRLLRRKGKSPYHLCSHGKRIVKRVVRFVSRYEQSLSDYARRKACDGVICGHLHTPKIIEGDDFVYCNTGDWVEHCTALVEDWDGTLSLVQFYGNEPPTVSLRRTASIGRQTEDIRAPARSEREPIAICEQFEEDDDLVPA
jgi:UDP-2,3-diacylglucosamine pyrophosphatase LpxH